MSISHDSAQAVTSIVDPAASLRAAALLTLKSKRKRPTDDGSSQTLPPRPLAVQPSIVLDYGQAEVTSPGASSTASSAAATVPAARPQSTPTQHQESVEVPMDVDPAREEGEISESEAPTPKISNKGKERAVSQVPVVSTAAFVAIKTEPVSSSVPDPPLVMSPAPMSPGSVDASHVRPGLAITQAEYDLAKEIILDLLGWGVPPEYLVHCGLSRQMIYFVFSELQLRLPSNLDTTGLQPYDPPSSSQSSMTPPASGQQSGSTVLPVRPSPGHPSLPQKPHAPQGSVSLPLINTQDTVTSSTPAQSVVSTPKSADTTLLDMEQQKRKELLARKAALARKGKFPASNASLQIVPPRDTDVEMNDPTPTVDDFLKTIGPSTNAGKEKQKSPAPQIVNQTTRHDAMDVDEPIPGLSSDVYRPPAPSATPLLKSVPAPHTMVISPPSEASTSSNESFRTAPTDFVNPSRFETSEADSVPGLQMRSWVHPPTSSSNVARRTAKRPVAADFVDMENVSSRAVDSIPTRPLIANGHHASVSSVQTFMRKKSGFAALSTRKCVIHVSDSEDEEPGLHDNHPRVFGHPSRMGPPSLRPHRPSPPSTPRLSPVALLAKEKEIKRMRELIEQRENKLKRHNSGRSPPTTTSVKQEEDDSFASVSLHADGTIANGGSRNHLQDLITSIPHDALPVSASTSPTSATLIDIPHVLEHSTTGDKVLTDEAQHEQVVNEVSSGSPEPQSRHLEPEFTVDVVDSAAETSSAQIKTLHSNKRKTQDGFTNYESPLDGYPSLREYLRLHLLGTGPSPQRSSIQSQPYSTSSLTNTDVRQLDVTFDLRPLKYAAQQKVLATPSQVVCQYELGGECRDRDCRDLHLSRMQPIEPSDEETALYLHTLMPPGSRYTAKQIQDTLEVARGRYGSMGYDDRVSKALALLGYRLPSRLA